MLTALQQYHIEEERWQYHFEEYLHNVFCKSALEDSVSTDKTLAQCTFEKTCLVLAETVRRADEHMAGAARAKENMEMLRKKIPVGGLKNELN